MSNTDTATGTPMVGLPAEGASQPWQELGLTRPEYDRIIETLGRRPTAVELAMYSLMWSEHCGYKHSRPVLRRFPTTGKHVLQGPGENAGVVDIGDGWAIAFKIESHNHPSAIEPYQGAATGVGGIVRDIIAMGARPIALLDSLRFGSLDKPRVRYLFEEVVHGIGGYGNCLGVPTIGGEVYFEDSYEGNCLVNAMCLGLLRKDQLTRSAAAGIGNKILLFGSKTGRDGIGGASVLASQEFKEGSEEKRPSVQVGDPFTEKLLIEASLELLEKKLLVALQDLGAAGITSSSAEMASNGGMGLDFLVDRVPLREAGMEPWEIMVSESQERMLAVVDPALIDEAVAVCNKWGLDATVVGEVTGSGRLRVLSDGDVVGDMPVHSLTDEAPVYYPEKSRPRYLDAAQAFDPATLPLPSDMNQTLSALLASPNIASRRMVFEQYDHMVQTNTVIAPGSDAAVIRIKETDRGIAVCTDCNGRYVYLDPRRGAAIAVAEAARNIAATGARPLGVTDCLNFGSPEKPEIFWQFVEAVEGISEACEALDVPVVGGNVSFYNESFGEAIYPTPTIGMVGLLGDVSRRCTSKFKTAGDAVFLVGKPGRDLGGSEYLKTVHGTIAGSPPALDLSLARRTNDFIVDAIEAGLLSSAHDVSDGGIATALAESCIQGGIGATISLRFLDSTLRNDELLFSESQSLFIVSIGSEALNSLEKLAKDNDVSISQIGTVGGQRFAVDDLIDIAVADMSDTYEQALTTCIQQN